MVDSGRTNCPNYIDTRPANGYVDAACSLSMSGSVIVAAILDAGTLEVAVDCGPSRYGSPTIPVVSYTSITGVVSTLSGDRSLDPYLHILWILTNCSGSPISRSILDCPVCGVVLF